MNKNLIALILIIIAIGLYFTFTRSYYAELQVLEAVNASYLTAINNSRDLIKARDQVLAKYNSITDQDKARLDTFLPNNINNVRLVIDINSIAARHGIALQGLASNINSVMTTGNTDKGGSTITARSAAASTPSADLTYTPMVISFSFSASYDNANSFIQDLESSLRLFDVTHLGFSVNDTGIYTYNIQLTTYWLKQ